MTTMVVTTAHGAGVLTMARRVVEAAETDVHDARVSGLEEQLGKAYDRLRSALATYVRLLEDAVNTERERHRV